MTTSRDTLINIVFAFLRTQGRRGIILLLCLAALLTGGCALIRSERTNELNQYLRAATDIWDFQGSVLVAKEGKVLLAKGYGWADRDFEEPNTEHTRFFIGSITKQFTAAAILQLQELGKLSLEDPITKYLPDYPHETGDRITIHQLLSHTAGVPNYTEAPEVVINRTREFSPQTLLDVFKDRPLDFEPGTDFHYSNSGYIILGAIIERVSGQSYEAYLHRNILKPLGMTNSGYARREAAIPERATGYTLDSDGNVVEAVTVAFSVLHTAGALYSTVDDLYKWDQALYREDVLGRKSLEVMLTPYQAGYSYGWFADSLYGRLHTFHGGFLDGYTTTIDRWVDDGLCVIVLSNQDEAPVKKMARALAAIVLGKQYDFPIRKEPRKLKPSLLAQYQGAYRIADDLYRLIMLKNDTLYDLVSGFRREKLLPQAKDVFFYDRDNTKIMTFDRNSQDSIMGLSVYDESMLSTAERLNGDEAAAVWVSRDAVELRPEMLDRFTGVYHLDSDMPETAADFKLTITRRDNRLFASVADGDRVELFPSSDIELFHQVDDFSISFTPDDSGVLTDCVLRFGRANVHGHRISGQ